MKKTFVKIAHVAILVLLALALVTCDGFLKPQTEEEVEFVDWEYVDLPNGRSELTLYLDGTLVPVTEKTKRQQPSRSLGLPLAKMSHDYFEVVFAYEGPGTSGISSVARATWELGQAAGISGVYRSSNGSDPGVDYRPVAAPAPAPAVGKGASIVFVGRKQTMTLLGVGFMTHINKVAITDTGGGVPSKFLTTADRSVTFTVSPLTANIGIDAVTGLAKTDPASSFLTSVGVDYGGDFTTPSLAQTIGSVTALGGTDYPLFELPSFEDAGSALIVPGPPPVTNVGLPLTDGTVIPVGTSYKTIAAQYTVGGLDVSGVTLPTGIVAPNGGDLTAGVLLYDIPEVIKREPRYISGGQTWYAVAQIDYRATLVDLDLDTYLDDIGADDLDEVLGKPIEPVIPMIFYLTAPSNGIFSIVFSVPVYALTLEPTDTDGYPSASTNGGPPAQIWHITPGYGQNLYNLDNGIDAGGCVLIGINVTSLDWLEIFTTGIGFKH